MKSLARKAIPVAICVVIALAAPSCNRGGTGAPVAEKGRVDLSSWDFRRDGPVSLKGEWEFHWCRFLGPGDFRRPGPGGGGFIDSKDSWGKKAIDGGVLPEDGFATYRIRAVIGGAPLRMAMKFPEINTAFVAFVNGRKLTESGTVGDSAGTSVPRWFPHYADFTAGGNELEIILWVSNYHYIKGGLFSPIQLGTYEDIAAVSRKTMTMDMIVFGSLFIMGLYHISIFLLRRKEYTPLYFGLFCFLIAARMLTTGDKYLNLFAPGISWECHHKLEYLSFSLAVPVFAMFFDSLFRGALNRWVYRTVMAAGLGISLLILLTDSKIYSNTGLFFKAVTLAGMAYAVSVLVVLCVRSRESAAIFLAGFSLLVMAAVNDILHDSAVISTGYYFHYGLFLFIFSQSFILSLRFLRAFQKIENLTQVIQVKSCEIEERNVSLLSANSELEELKKDLEQKVRERTATIEEQKLALENQKSEMDDQIRLAKEIQSSLLPKNIPSITNMSLSYEYVPMMGVGGDFIDIIYDKSSESLDLFICDVSGHGVPAALLAAMVKMSLQSIAGESSNPSETLIRLQESLAGKMSNNFITACMGSINLRTGTMRLANAGHPPIILLRGDGRAEFVSARGKIIHDMIDYAYTDIEIQLEEGEKIVFYTDGITETRNVDGVLFGDDNLISLVRKHCSSSPEVLCRKVMEELKQFTRNGSFFSDDIAILIAEYAGPAGPAIDPPQPAV